MKKTWLLNSYLRSAEFLNAPARARGVWVALQAYVSERETGGVIVGAVAYTPSTWRALTGTGGGRLAVDGMVAAGLATWRGPDLVLDGYDTASEHAYQLQRDGGRAGGLAAQAARRDSATQHERSGDGVTMQHRDPADAPPPPQPRDRRASRSTLPTEPPSTLSGERGRAEIREGGESPDEDGEAEQSPDPLQGEAQREARDPVAPTRALNPGSGSSAPLASNPMDVIKGFEAAYLATFGTEHLTHPTEEDSVRRLWDRMGSGDRARLLIDVQGYMAGRDHDHDHASLGDWVGRMIASAPEVRRRPVARTGSARRVTR